MSIRLAVLLSLALVSTAARAEEPPAAPRWSVGIGLFSGSYAGQLGAVGGLGSLQQPSFPASAAPSLALGIERRVGAATWLQATVSASHGSSSSAADPSAASFSQTVSERTSSSSSAGLTVGVRQELVRWAGRVTLSGTASVGGGWASESATWVQSATSDGTGAPLKTHYTSTGSSSALTAALGAWVDVGLTDALALRLGSELVRAGGTSGSGTVSPDAPTAQDPVRSAKSSSTGVGFVPSPQLQLRLFF